MAGQHAPDALAGERGLQVNQEPAGRSASPAGRGTAASGMAVAGGAVLVMADGSLRVVRIGEPGVTVSGGRQHPHLRSRQNSIWFMGAITCGNARQR